MKKLWAIAMVAVLVVSTWSYSSRVVFAHSPAGPAHKGKITIKGCNAKGTVKFMFWGDKGDLDAQTKSIKLAEKSCKGLNVVADWHESGYDTALPTAIGSGNAPDLFQLDGGKRIPEFVSKGSLLSLDSFVKRDKLNVKKVFWPQCLGEMSYHGHLYGLERSCGNQKILYYNKDMFKARGVKFPTNKWTVSDFLKAAEKLTGTYADASDSSAKLRFGTALNTDDFGIQMMMFQWGGNWLSKDLHTCTLTSSPVKKAFQWYHDLRWVHHAAPTGTQENTVGGWFNGFQQGTIGMTFAGAWALNYLFHLNPGTTEKPVPFKWGAALEPKGPKSRLGVMAGTAEVIYTNSKNKNAAWWLDRFVSEGPGAALQGAEGIDLPGAKALWNSAQVKNEYPASLLKVARASQKVGQSPRLVPQYDNWWNNTLNPALTPYWNSESASVSDATAKACADANSKGLLP